MYRVDTVVVGAGAVGLACAAELASRGREVLVLEREAHIGTGISSRNSEVIHAGLYYPPGSLKASLCVAGNRQLYRFCEQHGVPHRRIGKLLVAVTEDERPALEQLADNARASGVTSLQPWDRARIQREEPALRAVAGLWSPETGILDSHAFMLALAGKLEAAGGQWLGRCVVRTVAVQPGGFHLCVDNAGEPVQLACRQLVNAAGLDATALAAAVDAMPPALIPALRPCKGRYFSLVGASPFTRLIYPMPEANTAGLGVHATLDLAGRVRFGPDVEYVPAPDYRVEPERAAAFAEAIRRYYPALEASRLQPDYAGVRPKLAGPGEPARDFLVQGVREHRLPGLVHLFGVESPGLTASLALAALVADQLDEEQ